MHENRDAGTLFEGVPEWRKETNGAGYQLGPMEKAVQMAIEELNARKPLDGIQQALAQVAMELARNIGWGNRKGRAIANEAMQLNATLELLKGEDDETTVDQLPEAVRLLAEALSAPARNDAATVRDSAES